MPVDRRPYPSFLTCGLVFILAGLGEAAHSQRLPKTVIPDNYKLFLDPDVSSSKFSGEKVPSFGGNGAVSALGNFCTPQSRDDVRQFFVDHRAPGAERALQQSLERTERCIEFNQLQHASVAQWLEHQQR